MYAYIYLYVFVILKHLSRTVFHVITVPIPLFTSKGTGTTGTTGTTLSGKGLRRASLFPFQIGNGNRETPIGFTPKFLGAGIDIQFALTKPRTAHIQATG
ncbi:hypothetical protein THUN1379_20980 [Paludibacterium sp. THUN1379]|nr:hypothetical protein THUN1379_20980 [Paludibacterium sp. THUN1379]